MKTQTEILDEIYNQTIDGMKPSVVTLTQEALNSGLEAQMILIESLIPALEEVGRLFESGEYFVPEMLVSAKAMKGSMEILNPLIAKTGAKPLGTFLMGTVEGDIHDIGKNLCNIMLESGGFSVIDIGVNVPPVKFVEAIEEHQPEAVGLSAFLTTTMPKCITTIEAIEKAGLRNQVKIFLGGAPMTQKYADEVGADGYAPNGSILVRRLKETFNLEDFSKKVV
ncbi:MAG: corrinoid protein [SAR324 cluster bacterium]|jgi:5-methyltetrahydrofolate--homocysteine methyltransferase|nr:corrinoid protein [SAR324 cluster bacterium]|tara:strand:+ start:44 stop:715 length:672 start_codon:yes stop_codon:yes gene_type:complete